MQAQIKQMIEGGLDNVEATVTGDGSHFEAIVVGECFADKTPLVKQKMVYATLGDKITNGEIHAITIKAFTAEQWQQAQKFQVGSA